MFASLGAQMGLSEVAYQIVSLAQLRLCSLCHPEARITCALCGGTPPGLHCLAHKYSDIFQVPVQIIYAADLDEDTGRVSHSAIWRVLN